MKKEEKIERTVVETKTTYFCDFCGVTGARKCCNCKKDICQSHSNEEYDGGDYPLYYCPECYVKYRKYKKIEREHEEILEKEWNRIMKSEN